jgi:pyruvate dehydrogenase E2 component (dihydrolipoamide acetyltransferase)
VAFEFKLPDLGEGVAEGEIVAWKVKEGDSVKDDQPLVEVMTDKATVEIPSPRAGKIAKIAFAAGQVVPVGQVIVVIEEGGSAAAPQKAAEKPVAEKTAEAKPAAEAKPGAAAAKGAAPAKQAPPQAAPAAARPAVEHSDEGGSKPPASGSGKAVDSAALGDGGAAPKVLATPATRKLARDLDLDIAQIPGTGPRGRVTREDVRGVGTPATMTRAAAAASDSEAEAPAAAAPQAPAARPQPGPATRVPYRGIRKKIGDQMVRSAFTAPHFTLVEEIDMTEVDRLRERAKPDAEKRGQKITYLPFIVKALVAALKKHPTMNSMLDEQAGEQVIFADVHVGFALDTERGLLVPVLKDAHRKNVYELAADLQRLGDAGRAGTIAREDLTGSTITVTSAGSIGGLFATPILNYPEVAILGVYRIEDRAVVKDGAIVVRKMMYLSVTLDHRVVDGGEAARFLNTMKRYLGDPTTLVLEG